MVDFTNDPGTKQRIEYAVITTLDGRLLTIEVTADFRDRVMRKDRMPGVEKGLS